MGSGSAAGPGPRMDRVNPANCSGSAAKRWSKRALEEKVGEWADMVQLDGAKPAQLWLGGGEGA